MLTTVGKYTIGKNEWSLYVADRDVKTKFRVGSITQLTELHFSKSNAPPPAVPAPLIPAVFNKQYAHQLHGYLFQDVYLWAGETRADHNF